MARLPDDVYTVLSFIGDIYNKPKQQNITEIKNLNRVLLMAAKNRVLYHFVRQALKADAIKDEEQRQGLIDLLDKGKVEVAKFYETLRFLNSFLVEGSFLVLKTYKAYPYVTWDVDILVQDMEAIASLMEGDGFEIRRSGEAGKASCHREEFLAIGLHGRISWHSLMIMDDGLQWQNPRLMKFGDDIEVFIPNYEADLLTFIGHTNFENYHLILGDLLYIYRLAEDTNWDIVQEQVAKYGWRKSFERTIAIINELHRALYDKPSPMEKIVPSVLEVKPKLPFMYPHHYIIAFHKEVGTKPLSLLWELFFYTYRLWRIWRVNKPSYLDSFLYFPLAGGK